MKVALRLSVKSFGIAVLLLILTGFAGVLFAQAPNISYPTPQNSPAYKTIIPISPKNSGGMVPANAYGQIVPLSPFEWNPLGITIDANGNIYEVDNSSRALIEISPAGVATVLPFTFTDPQGVTIDNNGNIYVADGSSHTVEKISPLGIETTFAGSGVQGSSNGQGTSASFYGPIAIAVDAFGNVYVVDDGNNLIRKITPSGLVTTFASGFNEPRGIAIDASGNVYVADMFNNEIKEISPAGVVSVLAGNGATGATDGTGTSATFYSPVSLALDNQGNLYVVDAQNELLRKINLTTDVVTTIPGFYTIFGIVFSSDGNLYGTDGNLHRTEKILLSGYTIDKPLPAGLIFDFATGTISGTPVALSPPTNYTITAYNPGGSSSTIINIAVNGITPVVTTSTITGNIVGCVGSPGESPNVGKMSVAATGLSGDVTVTPPAGFDISLTAIGGYSTSLTLKQIGGAVISTAIYIRSSAADPVGPISGNIQVTTANATADLVPVTGVVNTLPTVNPVQPVSYNNGAATTPINFGGTGNTYNWTNDIPGIGLPAAGTGNIPSFTAIDVDGDTPVTATLTVTPVSSATGCTGTPVIFTITVNPNSVAPGIQAGTASGTISACTGTPSANPNIQQFTVSGSNLTGDITATAPANFEVSLSLGSGYSTGILIPQSAGAVNNVTVYVRSLATATGSISGNTISGNITLSSPGATDQSVAVTGTVYSAPTVSPVTGQTVTSGQPTAAISFSGTAGFFTWTNDTPGIGLAANGIGNIPSFTAINASANPVIATITVMPQSMSATACNGSPVTFTITVNPAPPPVITSSATLTGLGTIYGTASSSESFTVSATNATAGILITPPQGFEVSLDNTTFSPTVTAGQAGTITNVPVYIRLAATTPFGNYLGNIVLSTTGAGDVNAGMPLSTVGRAILTIIGPDVTRAYGVQNPVFVPQYQGFVNGDNQSSLTTLPALTTTATITSPEGKYTIHVSGGSAHDYVINPVDGTLTIIASESEIKIPNAFTPNGDGINDLWTIQKLSDFPQCLVSIYTRYGSLVFQTRGYPKPWDGTMNGSPVPTGTYYYVIDLNQAGFGPLTGYIAVLR